MFLKFVVSLEIRLNKKLKIIIYSSEDAIKQKKCPFLNTFLSGRRDSNSRPLAWKANALSTELLPQLWRLEFRILKIRFILIFSILSFQYSSLWGEQDSNLRRRTSAELQSAPVGHFGISPIQYFNLECQNILTDRLKPISF